MEDYEGMSLIKKLAKIRAMSDVAQKSKRGFNYTYADITEILANVTTGMKKYGVSLIPCIVPGTSSVEQSTIVNTKTDKTGKPFEQKTTEYVFKSDMIYRWVNDDNPADCLEVPWFTTGSQADPSQALGAGLTYCSRQFLVNYFQIAQTDNDVDAYRSKQKAAAVSEEKAITDEIIKTFDMKLRDFLAAEPDKREEVKAYVGTFVKSGDYTKIKEAALAGKMLSGFEEKFLSKGV